MKTRTRVCGKTRPRPKRTTQNTHTHTHTHTQTHTNTHKQAHRGAVRRVLRHQLLHVLLVRVLVAADLLVHQRLREHGLVDLVVAVLPACVCVCVCVWVGVWVGGWVGVWGGAFVSPPPQRPLPPLFPSLHASCTPSTDTHSHPSIAVTKAPPPVAHEVHHDVLLEALAPLAGQLARAHLAGRAGRPGGATVTHTHTHACMQPKHPRTHTGSQCTRTEGL